MLGAVQHGATVRLSRREREVANLVADGLSNREVGERLFISERTVEYHVEQIFNKLGLRSRTQIAGWIAREPSWAASNDASTKRGNLPLELTSFVGRNNLIELRTLLEGSRLLTLVGPGGIGKTRLALKLAANFEDLFADGVWLVELAALSDGELVVQTIASAVAIPEAPRQSLLETMVRRLSGWAALIILDNCEHVIEPVASASEHLLKQCPRLRILTTSREPLKAEGEVTWQVPPLGLPVGDESPALEAGNSEAIRLFIERGLAADPRASRAAELGVVAQICRRLDGMPLAIELAAARLSVMSPQTILDNLERRFDLLTGGSRNAVPRHRTLAATVDWSYALLTESERILFRRLSVFNGSFSLEAAEAICAGDQLGQKEVMPALLRLCERSLLSRPKHGSGSARYRMLETLRQYGGEHLPIEAKASLSRRHAEYFDDLASQAFLGSMSPDRGAWIDRVNTDVDNIRSAFDWALGEEPRIALRLATNLEFFWRTRSYLTEALDRTIAALERLPDRSPLRVQGLGTAAMLAAIADRHDESRRFADEWIEIAREISTPADLNFHLGRAGYVFTELGDAVAAEAMMREALQHWEPSRGDRIDQNKRALLLQNLGWASFVLGKLDAAVEYSNRALNEIEGGKGNPQSMQQPSTHSHSSR